MYTTALKLGSRRQSRRRKEREPRGVVPAAPPVSAEEAALRERLAQLERDADPATKQHAAKVYWDTCDAERASGSSVTAAIRAAYRARIAALERAGDPPAPDLDAVHNPLPPDDTATDKGAPAGEGGDGDDGDTPGRVPPDAPTCVYTGCDRPATRRMVFSNDPDAEEFCCDEHADLVRKLCADPHYAYVIVTDAPIDPGGDGAPSVDGAPARLTLPDRATQLADAQALLADAQRLDRKYTIVARLAACEDAVWRRAWVEWWRDSEDSRHLVVCYDAGDLRGVSIHGRV